MSKIWALVPAKAPERSKTRLSGLLQADECAGLSRAMLRDVLDALLQTPAVQHVVVLTDNDSVAAEAEAAGCEAVRDVERDTLAEGLTHAASDLAARGVETLLIIPGDMPTITPADVERLLARHEGGLTLCPAIRDGGTNALVCTPPDALAFQFGDHSAERHLAAAQAAGIAAERAATSAFFRDIDVPEDLAWLVAQSADTHTGRFLQESGIAARVVPAVARAGGQSV